MSSTDIGSLDALPTFVEALKLPKDEYYKYANGVLEYKANCMTFVAEMYEKFFDWCQALNCIKSLNECAVPPYPEGSTTPAAAGSPSLAVSKITTPLVTLSYSQLMTVVGYNGTCFDDYYCNQRSVAPYLHYILGVACLAMCLAGILSTLLFLPAFNTLSNRTGVTLYLTAMAVVDCLYMALFTVIVVIQYIPYDFTEQLEMYSRFTAYLIPHGLPSMQLMELLSVWITVAILVDRFLYLKFGFHSKIICSRKVSGKIIVAILVLLTIYTIPKYLEFNLIEFPHSGVIKVMYTSVGFSESFQNMLLHWLKVPIEMFLPYLADAIFSVINSIKFYDLMYKRKLSEASKDKRMNAEMNNINEFSSKSPMFPDGEKETLKFPSLTINSNNPIIAASLKSAEDKENSMVIVSLLLGFLLIGLKIPKFILHALKSEEYVDLKSTKFFQPVNDFLDLSWVMFKPLIYICIAKHFRSALKSVFCCNQIRNDTVVEVCPAVEMTAMANEYIRNTTEISSNSFNNSLEERERLKLSAEHEGGIFMKTGSTEGPDGDGSGCTEDTDNQEQRAALISDS